MAEFSEEYWVRTSEREFLTAENLDLLDIFVIKEKNQFKGDFSFHEEFQKLKERQSMPLICEGFGTKAIGVFDGENCILR